MKNKTILILSVVMVITTLTGCQPTVTPKTVPVSGTFQNVANTTEELSVYQWDGVGDYYNAATNAILTVKAKDSDILAFVDGTTIYLNTKWIDATSVNPDKSDGHGEFSYWDSTTTILTEYHFVGGATITSQNCGGGYWDSAVPLTEAIIDEVAKTKYDWLPN